MSLKKNIISNYVARVFTAGSIYLFVPFYVQLLGVDAYGILSFSIVLLSITSLADVGLSVTFSRELAKGGTKDQLATMFKTIERILLLGSGAIAAIFLFLTPLLVDSWLNIGSLERDTAVISLRFLSAALPLQLLVSFYVSGLLALERQSTAAALQSAHIMARSGLVILLLWWSPNLTTFAAWQLLVSLVFLVIARTVLLRHMHVPPMKHVRFDLSAMRPLARFAGGILLISIISAVNIQLDKVVVSKFFTVTDLGHYSLASSLAQLPVTVAGPIMVALFPRFTALSASGQQAEAGRLYERFSFIIASISSVGAFALLFFPAELLQIWLQRPMPQEAISATQFLSVGSLFLALQLAPFNLSLANGHNATSVKLGLAALVVTIPSIFVAAQYFGLPGVASIWILLNAITFSALAIIINRRFHAGQEAAWLWRATVAPVAVALAMMLVGRLFADHFSRSIWISIGCCAMFGSFALLVQFAILSRQKTIAT